MPDPTLDQLRVLAAVAEAGSFSAAARRLRRTQSVISYTIANLEAQLGLTLFERGGPGGADPGTEAGAAPAAAGPGAARPDPARTSPTQPAQAAIPSLAGRSGRAGRRPRLTQAGRALLADAQRIGLMVDELRARADGLALGLEAELGLAVDVMYPTSRLVAVLDAFARAFPTVTLRLRVEALGGPLQLVLDRECGLGIVGGFFVATAGLETRGIGAVSLVPVCAPGHPLAREAASGALPDAVAREHVQLVLTDRSTLSAGRDFGVTALRSWRLGDLGAKHALLVAGLGWGSMPEHLVAEDLRLGRLVRLQLARAPATAYPLALAHRRDARPGPAACWLARQLAAAPG